MPKGDKPGGGRICGSLRGVVLGLARTLQGSPCLPDPFPRSSLRWGIWGGVQEKSRAGVGWGGMFRDAGRGEGAAAATFWLDAHFRPQGAGARLCASALFPRTRRWPPRPPAVSLAPAAPQSRGRKGGGGDGRRQWGPEMTQSRPSWRAWHAGGRRRRPSRTSARRPPAPQQSCLFPLRPSGRVIAKAGTSCSIYRQRGAQREREAGCGGAGATPVPPECGWGGAAPPDRHPALLPSSPPPPKARSARWGQTLSFGWAPSSREGPGAWWVSGKRRVTSPF